MQRKVVAVAVARGACAWYFPALGTETTVANAKRSYMLTIKTMKLLPAAA